MSVVSTLKESSGFVPLALCAFSFQGTGEQLLVSTHPFSTPEGGPAFPGAGILPSGDYVARIQRHNLEGLQERSQLGIDRFAKATIDLFDADHYIWSNFVLDSSGNPKYGFRGASVQIALTMWQPGTSTFAADAPLLFVGTCDQELPRQGTEILSITANNGHNTATVKLPMFPIQSRCPLYFPSNAAERLQTIDPGCAFCPYAPDQTGAIGNTTTANLVDPTYGNAVTDKWGIYIMCDYTRSSCMERLGNSANTSVAPDGDLMHDKAPHATGAFAGIEWSPGTYYAYNKNYTSGQKIATFSYINSAVWGQYQNLLYSTQFVTPKISNIIEDGNATKMEAMICTGNIGSSGVQKVIVNGIEVPYNNSDVQLTWRWVNTGGRFGHASTDTGYSNSGHSALGDPYGSIATIEIVVYKDVFTGFGTPTVQVLASGPQLWVYTDQTTKSLQGTPYNSNPAWVLLDLLKKANWQDAEIDMPTFITAAAFCDTSISYVDQTGTTQTHPRFKCQFSLEQRKSAAEVIAGVLRCMNGYMTIGQNGLLQLFINQALGDAQPSTITGSNYNTAVPTIKADNSNTNGYVAYHFNESNIVRTGSGDTTRPDLEFEQAATITTPNQIYIQFQDEDNQYVMDSVGEIDQPATLRAGGALQPGGSLIPENLTVTGISNFDQAVRIANVSMAERQRGNAADDPRGTMVMTFGTTVKCEHLRVGNLILFSWKALGIARQLFRVMKIAPGTDFAEARVTASWHNDVWYTDLYGQAPQALYSETNRNRPARMPLPWQAWGERPVTSATNPVWSSQEYQFAVAEIDSASADGSPIVELQISGAPPINQVSAIANPPLVPVQATVSSTGGHLTGGQTLYFQLCATDSDGNLSAPSQTIMASIPAGTNTNTVTIPKLGWQAGTAGYMVFGGSSSLLLARQATGSGQPSSIVITGDGSTPNGLEYISNSGPPDLNAATINCQVKRVIHSGIFAGQVASRSTSPNTITLASDGTLTVDLTNRKLLLIGRPNLDGATLPIIDFTVLSNAGYVLTVDRDPTLEIQVDDLMTVCLQANIASATTIGDALLVNDVYPTGATSQDVGLKVRIISGTGRYQERTIASVSTNETTYTLTQQWHTIPDSTSLFIVEDMAWKPTSSSTLSTASDPVSSVVATVDVANYLEEVVLVQCLVGSQDVPQRFSVAARSPLRMIFLWGAQGTRYITGDATMLATDSRVEATITVDRTYTCLPFAQVPNQTFTMHNSKDSTANLTVRVDPSTSDTFEDGSTSFVLTPGQTQPFTVLG